MACIAAVQLGLLLVIAEIGNSRMPAGFIPAGTVTQNENIDLWTFIMLSLVFASLWCLRSVAAPGEDTDPASACFLSRSQANEWKGWMQVAFVAYHYTNAQDVYVPIRWCVSACSSYGVHLLCARLRLRRDSTIHTTTLRHRRDRPSPAQTCGSRASETASISGLLRTSARSASCSRSGA